MIGDPQIESAASEQESCPQAARMMRKIKRRAFAGDAYLRLFWTNIPEYGVAANSTEHAAMDHLEAINADRQEILRRIQNYSAIA